MNLQVAKALLTIDPGSAEVVAYVMGNSMPLGMFSDMASTYALPPKKYFADTSPEKTNNETLDRLLNAFHELLGKIDRKTQDDLVDKHGKW